MSRMSPTMIPSAASEAGAGQQRADVWADAPERLADREVDAPVADVVRPLASAPCSQKSAGEASGRNAEDDADASRAAASSDAGYAPRQHEDDQRDREEVPPEALVEVPGLAVDRTGLHGAAAYGVRLGRVGPVAVQRGVEPAARDQLVVRALLDDLPVLEHDDQVGAADRREAVGDDERGAPGEQQRRAPRSIRRSVPMSTDEVASSRIRMRGSASSARANATSWRWPSERRVPRSCSSRVVAVLEPLDELVRADRRRGGDDVLAARVRAGRRRCCRAPCRRRGSPPAARCRAGGAATPASRRAGRRRRS